MPVGPITSSETPRFVGMPFDSGVSYRPGDIDGAVKGVETTARELCVDGARLFAIGVPTSPAQASPRRTSPTGSSPCCRAGAA